MGLVIAGAFLCIVVSALTSYVVVSIVNGLFYKKTINKHTRKQMYIYRQMFVDAGEMNEARRQRGKKTDDTKPTLQ